MLESEERLLTPSWLWKARWDAKLLKEELFLSSVHSSQISVAMHRVKECASRMILSRPGFDAFCNSLSLSEDNLTQDGTIAPAVSSMLKDKIEDLLEMKTSMGVYIADFETKECDAFHVDPEHLAAKKITEIRAGNIFLFAQFVSNLPTGSESTWRERDKKYIMLVSWHFMHELSHALASVLAHQGILATRETPEKATGFVSEGARLPSKQYYVEYTGQGTRLLGERGWYLEDKLGGHLQMIDDETPLVLERRERSDKWWFDVTSDTLDAFVRCDENFKSLFPLPLETPHEKQDFTPQELMKFQCRGGHGFDDGFTRKCMPSSFR